MMAINVNGLKNWLYTIYKKHIQVKRNQKRYLERQASKIKEKPKECCILETMLIKCFKERVIMLIEDSSTH